MSYVQRNQTHIISEYEILSYHLFLRLIKMKNNANIRSKNDLYNRMIFGGQIDAVYIIT